MAKLCAPIRDNDIKQLKATDNIVELLRLVFECGFWRKKLCERVVDSGRWRGAGKGSLKLCQFA